jgi:hypothetical protein
LPPTDQSAFTAPVHTLEAAEALADIDSMATRIDKRRMIDRTWEILLL